MSRPNWGLLRESSEARIVPADQTDAAFRLLVDSVVDSAIFMLDARERRHPARVCAGVQMHVPKPAQPAQLVALVARLGGQTIEGS